VKDIFVNLKRFDVPKTKGGICPVDNPGEWIKWVIEETVKFELGKLDGLKITYFMPESLIIRAVNVLSGYRHDEVKSIRIGCQGVYRENVTEGGNFGAFTCNLPAAAARNMGCTWSIIGHSEERKDKLGIINNYDQSSVEDWEKYKKAKKTVDHIMNQELSCAMEEGLNVLLCVGETLEEKGEGSLEEQKTRTREVLKSQLESSLRGIGEKLQGKKLVIGYEPIWAIGPGKTPPGKDYIGFVSEYIKEVVEEMHGFEVPVVYGGGLKEENAEMLSQIDTIDGGIVALTRFTGDIAFEPEGLKNIIHEYAK